MMITVRELGLRQLYYPRKRKRGKLEFEKLKINGADHV